MKKALQEINKVSRQINLSKTPALDHVRNLVVAGLNAIPCVGGTLASLFDSYIPKQKEKRLVAFVKNYQ